MKQSEHFLENAENCAQLAERTNDEPAHNRYKRINDMLGWFSAKTYAETAAWSKIIVDRATDRILGAHFVGHEGQELINIFGLAIKFGITAHQLKDNVYAYPTFSSDIRHMFGHV